MAVPPEEKPKLEPLEPSLCLRWVWIRLRVTVLAMQLSALAAREILSWDQIHSRCPGQAAKRHRRVSNTSSDGSPRGGGSGESSPLSPLAPFSAASAWQTRPLRALSQKGERSVRVEQRVACQEAGAGCWHSPRAHRHSLGSARWVICTSVAFAGKTNTLYNRLLITNALRQPVLRSQKSQKH